MELNKGTLTETVLWTNSSPTSSFSAQKVTLNDNISNYTYIKIISKMLTSRSEEETFIFPVDFIKTCTSGGSDGSPKPKLVVGGAQTSINNARQAYYASDTSIYFMANYRLNQSGSNNTWHVPIQIIGMK